MGGKGSEGGYERRRLRRRESIFSMGNFLLGFSWICREESLSSVVGRISTGGTDLLRFLGTGVRIPFGFLELGNRIGCS
jgi:hypothetical protein